MCDCKMVDKRIMRAAAAGAIGWFLLPQIVGSVDPRLLAGAAAAVGYQYGDQIPVLSSL